MTDTYSELPSQRVSLMTKTKDANWYESTIDYWINTAISLSAPYHNLATQALDIANGVINNLDYSHVITPLKSSTDPELRDLKLSTPIRTTNFVSSIRDKSIGEYIELPFPITVISNSEKAILEKKNFVKQKVLKLAVDKLLATIDKLQKEAEATGTEPTLPDTETFVNNVVETYLNKKADRDSKILKLIKNEVEFDDKRTEAYLNWWMTNQVYTMCGIEGNSVEYEIIPVMEGFPVAQYGQNIEDSQAFLHRYKLQYSTFIDEFRDLLSEEDKALLRGVDSVKGKGASTTSFGITYGEFMKMYPQRKDKLSFQNYQSSLDSWNHDEIYINRLFFKSETKVKIVTYVDLDGSQKEIPLPADYKLNTSIGDITYRYDWINVVFEAYRIGDQSTGIYIPPRVIPVQLNDRNNLSKCKLPVGGKVGIAKGMALLPIPIRLSSYQIIDNILVNRIESEVAKYQSYIAAIPKSALVSMDNNIGKAYYSIKNNSLLIYDDSKLSPKELAEGVRFISNDGLYNYINILIQLRDKNKQDAYAAASVNEDALGNIDTRATKGNVEYNIARARLGMVLSVQTFNNIMARDLTKLLEYSKIAWDKGKCGPVEDKKGKLLNFVVDVDEHLESEYGIFVKNSSAAQDKINHYLAIAQSAAQNDMMELAIESVDFDNMPGAKQTLLDAIDAKRNFDKEMAEYNHRSAQESTQALMQDKEIARQHESQLEQMKQEYETNRMLAEMEYKLMIEQMKLQAGTVTEGGEVDIYDKQIKQLTDAKKQQLAEMKQEFEKRKHSETLAFKKQQLATQERIAKMNKN